MKKFARFFVAGTFVVRLLIFNIVFAETEVPDKPRADKLTIDIDSVSQRLPPQIAYFVPDRTFNFNQNQPPVINMWPTNDPRNQTFNMTDLMMSQQRSYRYIAVPENHMRSMADEDPTTAYQNFNYQIDFAKIPDKEPDFKRFESLSRERDNTVKRVKSKKYIKRPVSINYANTSPNIRSRIKYIKIDHENKFEVSKDNYDGSGSASDSGVYSDEIENDMYDRSKIYKNKSKFKKTRRNKPHYSSIKLSHPIPSVENESSHNYESANIDENVNYHIKHPNHKNCKHPNSDYNEQYENDSGNYYENANKNGYNNYEDTENKRQKGFAIYLTKVIKHPKPYRSLRMDKIKTLQNGFVPTRIMSSVRGEMKFVHKPRKTHKPTIRERLRESGDHIVYTEDGYEDKEYDHGVEDKSLEYLSRTRRSTDVKNLKGQELIDHLDNLIRNVSDYLNSSEIIPDTDKKYPLYNSTDDRINDSPIRYSEYAKPVVDEEYSTELYQAKPDNCDDESEEIDLLHVQNDTSGSKKRLRNLGNKLDCLKKKLFGNEPLDNPLFQEEKVTQPSSDNIFANIQQEAESIQSISSVYSDVMDNIKYNSFNENQRVFSDYGVSDNFAVGSYNTNPVTANPENNLNTNEKYSNEYKEKTKFKEKTVTQSPLTFFNPFRDPAQLPILDISKYIPTPKYSTGSDDDIPLQTDFVPIVSPYATNYRPSTTTSAPTSTQAPPPHTYGPARGQVHIFRKIPPYQNNQNSNIHRNPTQNILLFKHRRPVAVVRIVPKNPQGPRNIY